MTDEPKYASVNIKTLGTNCWFAGRFVKGGCCKSVYSCKYPERATCLAVQCEVEYLTDQVEEAIQRLPKLVERSAELIEDLLKERGN